MASLTIRQLDDEVKKRLRLRAAARGHSMEEEARAILRAAVARESDASGDLGARIHARFAALGGIEIALPPREPARDPPEFA